MLKFDENDCCGNGCANCILDLKPQKQEASSHKVNIINNYSKFILKFKKAYGELLDILELHFSAKQLSNGDEYTLYIPSGHHIMMRAPPHLLTNGIVAKRLLRPYSPFFVDENELLFKILVNMRPNGQMSKYISSLNIGDEVEFRGPIGGQYVHSCASSSKNLVLISQGVAIASTLPIINEILQNEDDMTRIYHFSCFSNLKYAYFRNELQEFNKFWNYTGHIYLSRQFCDETACFQNNGCISACKNFTKNILYKEKVFAKRLNGDELLQTVGSNTLSNAKFVICGSGQFQNNFVDTIKNLDLEISDENVFLL